jgi:hypothetical protein
MCAFKVFGASAGDGICTIVGIMMEGYGSDAFRSYGDDQVAHSKRGFAAIAGEAVEKYCTIIVWGKN